MKKTFLEKWSRLPINFLYNFNVLVAGTQRGASYISYGLL